MESRKVSGETPPGYIGRAFTHVNWKSRLVKIHKQTKIWTQSHIMTLFAMTRRRLRMRLSAENTKQRKWDKVETGKIVDVEIKIDIKWCKKTMVGRRRFQKVYFGIFSRLWTGSVLWNSDKEKAMEIFRRNEASDEILKWAVGQGENWKLWEFLAGI